MKENDQKLITEHTLHRTDVKELLKLMKAPYKRGDRIAVKLHWGERGNHSFLPPFYAKEIVAWLLSIGVNPVVFDTTVLYSGGRRQGADSIATAARHGYTKEYLGCPVIIGDGLDGKDTIEIDAGFKHFKSVQVAALLDRVDGFFIFSHFTGHMAAGFGGAIKNISMGFASRAQKQRMHADVSPELNREKCTACGVCMECCPSGAITLSEGEFPSFNLDMCIGCAQCIAMCPQEALKVLWGTDKMKFQERLVETAAAVWRIIGEKSVLVNALVSLSAECDCLPGPRERFLDDLGFIGGYDPLSLDVASLQMIGEKRISSLHPGVPWQRQIQYANEIGFRKNSGSNEKNDFI
ncbi:MAG: DUF362 domain-containing protein [Syntrophales bacterium]|jgi:uncharacterized Fe-S center protein|nr:DUF362 domain-containing protein [Syntrophales bacterium]MDY0045525.1 DUF362 domain-containing protein [Syntrophales bacterium]